MTDDALPVVVLVAGLLAAIGVVYWIVAFGARIGEIVWAGRHVGRLPGEQRVLSFLYGLGLIASSVSLLELGGVTDLGLIKVEWQESAGVLVIGFLGVTALASILAGSRWERWLFGPIALLGAGLAWWLTFA